MGAGQKYQVIADAKEGGAKTKRGRRRKRKLRGRKRRLRERRIGKMEQSHRFLQFIFHQQN